MIFPPRKGGRKRWHPSRVRANCSLRSGGLSFAATTGYYLAAFQAENALATFSHGLVSDGVQVLKQATETRSLPLPVLMLMNFFDYFQVASVVIFLFILMGKILYLRLSRNINPITIGGGKKGVVLALELISVAGLMVWVIEVLLYAFHSAFRIFPSPLDRQLVSSQPAKLIGVALVSLGLAIFAMAYVSFGDSWRVGFDVKSPGTLVTTGVFSISRNPIYLSLDLWFIGIFLINGTLIFLIFAAMAVAGMHWQIRQEEAFLSNLYGQPYLDYCTRTGRYVGSKDEGGRMKDEGWQTNNYD